MSAAELERDGVTAIPQLLSPAQVEAALAALHRLFEHGVFEENGGDKGELIMHTPNLTARDQVFRDVVQLPRVALGALSASGLRARHALPVLADVDGRRRSRHRRGILVALGGGGTRRLALVLFVL